MARPLASLREVPSELSLVSEPSSGYEDVLRIRLSFGGSWKLESGNKWAYVDGETYLEKLPIGSGLKYCDLMFYLTEKINGSAVLKYTPPGEPLSPNNLVTVVEDAHVQEMIEEYMMALQSALSTGRKFRLSVWLSRAEEEEVFGDDAYARSASDTGESVFSDGTHSPMLQYAQWAAASQSENLNDEDMQAMVAQDACLYMNAMEEAESQEASNLYSNFPEQMSSGDWYVAEDGQPQQLDIDTPGSEKDLRGSEDGMKPDLLHSDSTNPGTPNPETPPISQRNAFRLPSSLGSSLGHAHTQGPPSVRPCPYRLPSRLGSDLGNPRHGTLRSTIALRPPRATYKVPKAPESGIKTPVAPANLMEAQEETPKGRTTPNGTPIPPGPDHFHSVPASQLKAVAKLGEGTFGEVLQCSNRLFGDIAVKCAKAEGDQELFSQEIRMLSSLNHPNVLRFFGVVTDDTQGGKIMGVMTEFMQGRSLSVYLGPEYPRLSLLERAKLARGAVKGLMYLHQHEIIHFDLKPENLLLDYPLGSSNITPGIKVADFGLSKYKVDSFASADSGLRGTIPYIAPEIGGSGFPVSEKADIWSLGMVLWEMFTHSIPFGAMSAPEITARLRSGNAFPHIPADMEPEWVELVEACCRSAPDDRYPLENIAAMLDQIIQAESRALTSMY